MQFVVASRFPAMRSTTYLLKSDGLPTYHLAVVVDDVLMGVNLRHAW